MRFSPSQRSERCSDAVQKRRRIHGVAVCTKDEVARTDYHLRATPPDTNDWHRPKYARSRRRWHTYTGPLSLRTTAGLSLFIHLDNDPIGCRSSERLRRVHLFGLGWGRHEGAGGRGPGHVAVLVDTGPQVWREGLGPARRASSDAGTRGPTTNGRGSGPGPAAGCR